MHTWIHIHQHYTQLGKAALHYAVDQEHEEIVDLLLKANADTDLPEKVIHTSTTHSSHAILMRSITYTTLYRMYVPLYIIMTMILYMMRLPKAEMYSKTRP